MIGKLKKAVRNIREKKDKPLHIEFNLTDYCNLNCKGCTHYSPLAPEEYQTLESLETTIKHIASIKNVELIEGVYLIGGETLLYPNLKDAMKLARRYFPKAKISIFTNGILIPKMDEEFWDLCKSEDCVIALTVYPIKFDYEIIKRTCEERGVKLEVFGDRGCKDSFFKFPLDKDKKQNAVLAHFRCISHGCITVDNGKIFPCSISACVRHLNNAASTNFKWEKGDYIPVENLSDAKELLKLRDRPVPFCKYCSHIETVEYGPSHRQAKEWIKV